MKYSVILIFLIWGSAMAENRSEKIVKVFNTLRADNVKILDDFYHPSVDFQDPVGKISGRDALKEYYKKMYKSVEEISFEFTSNISNGDNYMMGWTMRLKSENLNGGEEVKLDGVSHIVFAKDSDLVIKHRDYFDMGEFIYEHVPLLGSLIKYIKGKLK
jgi:hypothetical protein